MSQRESDNVGVIDGTVSRVLLALYRGVRTQKPERFKDWALGLLKDAVRFDKALWAVGDAYGRTVHSIHLHNIQPETMESWARHSDEDRKLLSFVAPPAMTLT